MSALILGCTSRGDGERSTRDGGKLDPVADPAHPAPAIEPRSRSPLAADDYLRTVTISRANGGLCKLVLPNDDSQGWVSNDGREIAVVSGGPQRLVVHTWSSGNPVVHTVVWDADTPEASRTCKGVTASVGSKLTAIMHSSSRPLLRYGSEAGTAKIELCEDRGTTKAREPRSLEIEGRRLVLRSARGKRVASAVLVPLADPSACTGAEGMMLTVDPIDGLARVVSWGPEHNCDDVTKLPRKITDALQACGAVMAGP